MAYVHRDPTRAPVRSLNGLAARLDCEWGVGWYAPSGPSLLKKRVTIGAIAVTLPGGWTFEWEPRLVRLPACGLSLRKQSQLKRIDRRPSGSLAPGDFAACKKTGLGAPLNAGASGSVRKDFGNGSKRATCTPTRRSSGHSDPDGLSIPFLWNPVVMVRSGSFFCNEWVSHNGDFTSLEGSRSSG